MKVTPRRPSRRRWVPAAAGFPLLLIGVGVFALVDAATIVVPRSSGAIGPRAFPYLVGGLLVVTGVIVLIEALRGVTAPAEESEDIDPDQPTDWVKVGLLAASLLALVVLIEPLGWPIAATVLFGGAAWSLGARPLWRTLLAGAVLALLTQIVFTQALDVYLPAGPLEGVGFLG